MKVCSKCKQSLPLINFNKKKSYYQSLCKDCNKSYQKDHYKANKEFYIAKARKYEQKINNYIREMKNQPCADCRTSHPYYVMDFDHRNPLEKSFNVASYKLHYKGYDDVVLEIAKCDVVCSNCHRYRTHKDKPSSQGSNPN